MTTYNWDEQQFTLTDSEIVQLKHTIGQQSNLTSASSKGILATIVGQPNDRMGHSNDVCQLQVAGKTVGSRFGCRANFTWLEWLDITGDGAEEVVIRAYSAGYALDRDGGRLSDETCMHQRLLAYQWTGQAAVEIANIAGCVIQSDLFGVRLEDYDQDGQIDIIAAMYCCGPGIRVYKWSGQKFVLWSEIGGK